MISSQSLVLFLGKKFFSGGGEVVRGFFKEVGLGRRGGKRREVFFII